MQHQCCLVVRKDVKDMLDFVVKHKIHPWIVERLMAATNEALEDEKEQYVRYSLILAAESIEKCAKVTEEK
ncbi:hypothetical protein BG011_006445 [Mortierella polycephala]|uniref:Uncharacterized protein n=1 Tax=Mortierella polycephala TaxID=41804 RepID=A0A9P6PUK0_9FUNG|nr:hypothetical protein BG011_006445 [Mortierella polycephala]